MKSDKIFFTVYACPDDWGMAQAMSSVFSTYLSICDRNNFPAWLNFFRDINTRILQMQPISLYRLTLQYMYCSVQQKTSTRIKKVAQGTKEVGFKNGVPIVYS